MRGRATLLCNAHSPTLEFILSQRLIALGEGVSRLPGEAKPGFPKSQKLVHLSTMTHRGTAKSAQVFQVWSPLDRGHTLSSPSGSLSTFRKHQHGCARYLQQPVGASCQAVLEGVYGGGPPRMHHKSTDLAGNQSSIVMLARSGSVLKVEKCRLPMREVRSF